MANIGYVTPEWADQYVAEHFTSADPLRVTWEGLDEEDREVLLRKSFESLEALPYIGRKTSCDQETAFPRYPDTEVPRAIMSAQVENAVSLSDTSSSEDAAFYERLWQFGVESYSIGNLSEKTSSGAWGRGSTTAYGVISAKATRLLQPYVNGSFNIRGPTRRCIR